MRYFFNYFLVLSLIFSASVFGQKDTLAGKNYTELSEILNIHLKDSATSLALSKYYIKKAQNENELLREAEGLHAIALIYYEKQEAVKAASAIDALITFVEKNELTTFELRTYQMAGVVYLTAAQIQKAIDATNKLLQLAEESNNETLKKQALGMLDFMGSLGGNSDDFITKYKAKLANLNTNPPVGIKDSILES